MWKVDVYDVSKDEGEKITEQHTFDKQSEAVEYMTEFNKDLMRAYHINQQLPDFYTIARRPYKI